MGLALEVGTVEEAGADGEPTGQKFCVVPAGDVAMGDQLLAQKPRVSVPAKVPPTAKPGAQRAAPRNDPLQAAQQRLAKTGKVDDAAEAFFHLINETG